LSEPSRRGLGSADILAGVAGGLFAPIATFGFGLPLWTSIPGAVLVFLGVRLAASPRSLFEGFRFGEADQASLELARDVLADAQAQADRLAETAHQLKSVDIRRRLEHLNAIATRVIAEVEQKPRRVNNVRRLLTYYLPATLRLAEGYRILESSNAPDRERLDKTGAMIARLDDVFASHADRLSADDVDGLDIELRLLEDSLRTEQTRR
jgi:5-bromo-4-chloroindolyl phosphate hydrolysis protein